MSTARAWQVFAGVRRVIVFGLGVTVILDGLLGSSSNAVPELIVGLVLVGVLPIEDVVLAYAHARAREPEPPKAAG